MSTVLDVERWRRDMNQSLNALCLAPGHNVFRRDHVGGGVRLRRAVARRPRRAQGRTVDYGMLPFAQRNCFVAA